MEKNHRHTKFLFSTIKLSIFINLMNLTNFLNFIVPLPLIFDLILSPQ